MDEKEQQSGHVIGSDQDNYGFQLVQGKKKKKASSAAVMTTTATKAKVLFHIPTIRKPQEEYNILVDNSNQPFEHVWLQRSGDGLCFVHPLEKLSVMNFVDKDIAYGKPIIPASIESTRSKLVEEVKDLKELAAKLRRVNEFAVDLEHNQYRSFQGLTCLMQISTRTEDFIVDTLKLRIHIGPYLREVFKDPKKKKVMHGADRDILWLQRDFGIYVCNLFDTGQASRVLKLERNSLEHLLQHYCGVTANKEYQNADWRLRPLPDEMLRYAREDTHYLLYIYDLMRVKLQLMPKEPEHCDAPLVEVYKRSADVCMQLYEKELLMENSYLHIYGLQGGGFNSEHLAIAAALCEWRDMIARAEDESTGYVLPNKVLLQIAKQMPVTTSKLCRLLKSKHPYVEQDLGAVVSIIKNSLQNAVAFEAAAQQLRMERAEKEEGKLERIRPSVNLSFHPYSGTEEQSKPATKELTRLQKVSRPEEPPTEATESTSEYIIMLEDNSNKNESVNGNSIPEDETMSLSELSTGFQQCFQSINDQQRNVVKVGESKEPHDLLKMKPFDYEAAMKELKFGTVSAGKGSGSHSNSGGKKKSSAIDDGSKQFPQARRQAAFPASGNGSLSHGE